MKLTKMFRVSAAALGCLLALISCRQGEDAASGPLAPVDVKVVNHLVAVLEHESRVLELVDPASGEKVKSIRLAQPPNGMAVDGATAYVAEGSARSGGSSGPGKRGVEAFFSCRAYAHVSRGAGGKAVCGLPV